MQLMAKNSSTVTPLFFLSHGRRRGRTSWPGPDRGRNGANRRSAGRIGSHSSKRLAWGLTESTKEFAEEYQTVTVVTPDGHEIKGVTLNEDQFSLQMMDKTEQIHLFEKDKLRSIQKSRDIPDAHLTTTTI